MTSANSAVVIDKRAEVSNNTQVANLEGYIK
jgi:hypothetical protein